MIDVRVSFQGGGVYLAKMLPIADAFQTLHENKVINIESVSGTSAGSICAALLANRSDFSSIRKFCEENLEREARSLANGFYDGVGWTSYPKLLWKVIYGRDIVSRDALECFVTKLMEAGSSRSVSNVENFHTDPDTANLFIARSKLHSDYLEIVEEGKAVSAIVDSCTIPFAFRGHKQVGEATYLDGGMCENLPVLCFDNDDNIPVFGVSVVGSEKGYQPPKNALGYLSNLFAMTVGYSVERSKKYIGESFLFQEHADFGFSEIKPAVNWYLDRLSYENTRDIYIRKLQDFAEYRGLAKAGSVFLEGLSTVKKRDQDLKSIASVLLDDGDWDHVSADFIVTAHSANPARCGDETAKDTIQNVSHIKAKSDGPRAYKTFAYFEGNRLHPTTWSVRNITKNIFVKFRVVHYQDSDDGGKRRDPCLVLFEDASTEISEHDELEVRMIRPSLPGGNMSGLVSPAKRDFIIMDNQHRHDLKMNIIVRYPSVLGRVRFVDRSENTVEFESLTESALKAYNSDCAVEFRAVGLTSVDDVESIGRIAVDFIAE